MASVNSKYYDVNQLSSTKIDVPSSFGPFHVNIASLNSHSDDLRHILSLLNYRFDVIGISEHNIRKDIAPSNNIFLPGYNEFFFELTETTMLVQDFILRTMLILLQGRICNLIPLEILNLL